MHNVEDDKIRRFADSAMLKVLVQLVIVVGLPVSGFFGSWIFLAVVDMQGDIKVLKEQTHNLTTSQYTNDDAVRDMRYINSLISSDESNIKMLQRQVYGAPLQKAVPPFP